MRCQVLLLAMAQALFQTASILVMTVGGLAGRLVAGDQRLATAPIAAVFPGTAIMIVPASVEMARYGRRALPSSPLRHLRMPSCAERAGDGKAGRPLLGMLLQPTYLVALFGAATGYGIMILPMTATPLAVLDHGHGPSQAALVIQLHATGKFAPSLFTGGLIARFGPLKGCWPVPRYLPLMSCSPRAAPAPVPSPQA